MGLRDCERLLTAIANVSEQASFSVTSRLEMMAVLAGLGADALKEQREAREVSARV